MLTHVSLKCLEPTGFLTANVSHGSDDLQPREMTPRQGGESPFLCVACAGPARAGWLTTLGPRRKRGQDLGGGLSGSRTG